MGQSEDVTVSSSELLVARKFFWLIRQSLVVRYFLRSVRADSVALNLPITSKLKALPNASACVMPPGYARRHLQDTLPRAQCTPLDYPHVLYVMLASH